MYLPVLIPLAIFIILSFLQVNIISFFSIDGIEPHLPMLVLIFFTLRKGQIFGTLMGALLGLIYDFISGSPLGINMLGMTLAGFGVGIFYRDNRDFFTESFLFFLLIVLFGVSVNSIIVATLNFRLYDVSFLLILLKYGILPGIYSALVSFMLLTFRNVIGVN